MRSIQSFLFVTLIGSLVFTFSSCSSSKKSSKNVLPQNALLWQIDVPGATKPSFVYGTIHIIPSEDFFYPEGTLSCFEKSDKVFFEIDMAEMTDMTAIMGIMDKLFMKDNLTLKDLYSEEEYDKISDFFKNKGVPLFFLERMKPMFLTVLTYGDMAPGDLQNGNMKSYEFAFMELAEKLKKKTGGLETIDFQIGVFDKIPYKHQAKMLLDAIEQSNVQSNEFEQMVALYKAQDIQKMVASIGEDEGGLSEYEDILLHERNKNWIPVIMAESVKQSNFFAVGAGHLGGKNGVLNLLVENGVKVKPILQ